MTDPSNILQGFVLILPEDGTNLTLSHLTNKIRGIYENVKVSQFTPTEDEKAETKYAKYNEFMIKADLNFGDVQHNKILKKNILQRFCQENVVSGIGESWLKLNVFQINDMKHRTDPMLRSFALGSIVHMNTFVEHFSSSWSADDKEHRITNPCAQFKHDVRQLHVKFNVTDKTSRVKSLKSHQLHMLDLNYNMFVRILIEVEKQPNAKIESDIVFVRLYLVMSGAPLIKVREVCGGDDDVEYSSGELDSEKEEVESGSENYASSQTSIVSDSNVDFNLLENSERTAQRKDKQYDKKFSKSENFKDDSFRKEQFSKAKDPSRQRRNVDVWNEKSFKRKSSSGTKDLSNQQWNNGNESQSYIPPAFVDESVNYYRLAEFGKKGTGTYCSSKVFGMSRVLRLDLQAHKDRSEEVWDTVVQLICCCAEAQVYFTSMKQHTLKKEFTNPTITDDFSCLFALKTIISPSFSVTDEINLKYTVNEINRKLKEYAKQSPEALERSLFEIQAKHEQGEIIRFVKALDSLFEQNRNFFQRTESRKSLPENMVLLRRALFTPTRIVFLPPIAHMKSYLLRTTDSEYALRVSIRDDNCDSLTYTVRGSMKKKKEFLMEVIAKKLINNIKIGKREYTMFGSSSSQLREHGCLFYAQDSQGNTSESIRKNLGDLHQIKTVAKYMARMGQSLSQALCNVTLEKEFRVGPVEDVYSGTKYVFSDGVGQMSQEVADMCYKAMGLENDDYKPSALQIRYAGCKGMILLNPDLKGKQLVLRKSMWKFDSDNCSIEILKGSYPQVAYLNRPFITILEQMGIKKEVLFELQNVHLRRIFDSLYDSSKAVDLLYQESVVRLPFKSLHHCGVDLAFEPFFRPMIMALYTSSIDLLKHKARVKIPFSHARTMLGVMDETRTLEYGQVFVQYTLDIEDGKPVKKTKILEGTILITKNPCMHPGDVRKFTAVDVEGLRHIKDCLVFPQKGHRPHPDEMAGSDLDGDEYCVVWYEPLIFERPNFEAMDYSNATEIKEKDKIDVHDMAEFMCDYIRDDCVGLIANAHLAWADTMGIFSDKCMVLAKKYSVTLDFAKSGKPERLVFHERVKEYPDFMEKFREKDSYLSTNALGHLFRNCKKIEILSNILSSEVPVEIDSNFVCEGWEEYEADAQYALLDYIRLFSTPTRLFHLNNEGEIMSGASIKKLEKSFQGQNIEKNVSKMLESVIPHVIKKMRDEFYKPFLKDEQAKEITKNSRRKDELITLQNHMFQHFKQASNKVKIEETPLLHKMLKKAAAWYAVAYRSKQDGSSLYLGLPWVVPEFLGILCARNKSIQKPTLDLKIKLFINSDKANLEEFLNSQPSGDPVELSKQIMEKWVETMSSYINLRGPNKKRLLLLLREKMKSIDSSLDVLEATTEELIYKYLITFARFYTKAQQPELEKELGMLAIISLSLITSTGNLWETISEDPTNSAHFVGLAHLTKEFREEIRFPLDLGKPRYKNDVRVRSKFGEMMLQHTSEIADLMQRESRVSLVPQIDFKNAQRFKNRPDFWYVLLSIYGKPFNIESLKDMVVQPSFEERIRRGIIDDCCVM